MTSQSYTGIGNGAINVASQREALADSTEIARLWVEDGGPGTFFINAHKMPEPEMFGMMMADAIRHGARAYAHALEISEAEAEAMIWQGLDEERAGDGDNMTTIDPGDRIS
ncbi:DUF5076 domain-containing protein [Sphingomonas sp. GCM10030256]|uniref:DUF5076 domain-containing protein n=1 Tax=Sphingomonas sp. GCM10030256 TaxID=3273427 RepID=UPI00361E1CED